MLVLRIYSKITWILFKKFWYYSKGLFHSFKAPNYIQHSYALHYLFREDLTFLELCDLVEDKACPTIIDVGSNIGFSTLNFKKRFTESNLICIEPISLNRKYFIGNLKYHEYNLVPLGVGEKDEKIKIGIPEGTNDTGLYSKNFINKNSIEIQIRSLDKIFNFLSLDNLDIIKIDVEGMEFEVIKGAESIIKKFNPVLYFEVNKKVSESYSDIKEYLLSLNYAEYNPRDIDYNKLNKFDIVWKKRQ